jgi:hypothetical protein
VMAMLVMRVHGLIRSPASVLARPRVSRRARQPEWWR